VGQWKSRAKKPSNSCLQRYKERGYGAKSDPSRVNYNLQKDPMLFFEFIIAGPFENPTLQRYKTWIQVS